MGNFMSHGGGAGIGTALGAGAGTLIAPGPGTALGASIGGSLGGAASNAAFGDGTQNIAAPPPGNPQDAQRNAQLQLIHAIIQAIGGGSPALQALMTTGMPQQQPPGGGMPAGPQATQMESRNG